MTDCPDCINTPGVYRPLIGPEEPCRTCGGTKSIALGKRPDAESVAGEQRISVPWNFPLTKGEQEALSGIVGRVIRLRLPDGNFRDYAVGGASCCEDQPVRLDVEALPTPLQSQGAAASSGWATDHNRPMDVTAKDFHREHQNKLELVALPPGWHVRQLREWYPVDEQLPETDQFVLVTNCNKVNIARVYDTGDWFAASGCRLCGVTHWRPLPDPPQAGGQA